MEQPPIKTSNEISLKELILNAKIWISYLLRNWKLIVLTTVIGAGLGMGYTMLLKIRYEASLSFVLEDVQSSGLGAYAGLANQFGFELGGEKSAGVFSGDNILAFLKSRLMIEKALLSTTELNGKPISLADYYLRIEGLRDAFDKDEFLKKVTFPVAADRQKFSRLQDSVLHELHERISTKDLFVSRPDKKLSFLSVKCQSGDELFSKVFIEKLVKEATSFYVETKTKRSAIQVNKLQAKADSIEALLNKRTYSSALSEDMNMNPARKIATVTSISSAREIGILQVMYAEVVKNLELSKMAMSQETPIIQIIDTPILPLEKVRTRKLKGVIIGGFLFGFLTVLILLARKIYREVMA